MGTIYSDKNQITNTEAGRKLNGFTGKFTAINITHQQKDNCGGYVLHGHLIDPANGLTNSIPASITFAYGPDPKGAYPGGSQQIARATAEKWLGRCKIPVIFDGEVRPIAKGNGAVVLRLSRLEFDMHHGTEINSSLRK